MLGGQNAGLNWWMADSATFHRRKQKEGQQSEGKASEEEQRHDERGEEDNDWDARTRKGHQVGQNTLKGLDLITIR